ncbi:hypothetical protein B0H67DRAFT_664066 [Lasiosphaeris hirsuta]|uniref:Histone deacetylase domain-containing protein n=1 Tax=Lasiosphaeris hirsuta TaxID=260670 RepID=A0AA40DT48_9PEZI|nr:hypothetical protein B0H67DRAFT_664066 [Lasiosphaeris hirsuta]
MAQPANKAREAGDNDLAQSLKQLSISASSPSPAKPRSPRPLSSGHFKPAVSRSPSTTRPSSSMRSPMRSPLNGASTNGSPSRSATPTLLRKASLNSLHSANGVAPPRRSSSANILSPRSPLRSVSPPEMPVKPAPTAESVASDYFQAELTAHHGQDHRLPTETIVFLHDACYGHRFSRPRTSRAALTTIVERPERIKACALGVSAAYVRLGDRHEEGVFPIRPRANPASLPSIPFRIQKTTRRLSLTSQTVTNVHGVKWMEELKSMCDSAEAKLAMNGKELQRPEAERAANGDAPKKLHEGDLYLCAESLDALEGSLGGLCDAVDAIFKPQGPKRAFVAIRPPGHHCSASYPSGFCWINNVHIGIMHAILSHGLTHAAIIDFDLHHGDGSQSIAWQHNARGVGLSKNAALWKKTSIGYFSLHDINSYPCEMGDEEKVRNASICIDNAHGQSIWNVHLQPWKTEAEFWALYETRYSVLLEKTRHYLKAQTDRLRAAGLNPRAAIFLSAGFDASEWEGAGMQRHNVNVPTEFYARLTRDVVRIAVEEGTGVEGRIVSVLEGGYSDRALCSGVLSHLCGLAGDDPAPKEQDFNGLGYEMGQRMGAVRGRKDSSASERGSRRYEPSWWSAAELEQLEDTMAPPLEPRKPRVAAPPPTYSTPTAASVARKVTPRLRRSVSGLLPGANGLPMSRAPSPPPPEVPWTIAAHELSKLLIPTGRQTDSCTHEDLNAEATRARRDRQSVLAQSLPPGAVPTAQAERAPTRMGLRGRKAKQSPPIDEEGTEDRRKTIAGAATVVGKAPKQSSRRLSAASTIVSEGAEPVPPAVRPAPIRGFTKPDTSANVRPESSMSARTANGNPLAVKKTRAPVKKEPVQRAPRGLKKLPGALGTGTAAAPRTSPLSATPTNGSPDSSSADKTMDDMEKLTGDMKKIKITLVTKAQRETRERERLAREKLQHTDSISVALPTPENKPMPQPDHPSPPALSLPDKFPSTNPSPGRDYFPEQSPELPAGPLTPASPRAPVLDPQRVPLPSSSPMPASPSRRSPSRRSPSRRSPARSSPTRGWSSSAISTPADIFIPYQPEGPTPAPVPQNQQPQQPQVLQWLLPNTETPVPTPAPTPSTMRRADLPVFTATSAIPFAPRSDSAALTPQGAVAPKRVDQSIWEIPETPQK